MAWFLTWLVQSVALVAVTAALVRLPGFRGRASARAAAWSISLAGTALLAAVPLLTWPAAGAAGAALAALPAGAADGRGPLVLPAIPGAWLVAGLALWMTGTAAWMVWTMREVVRVVRLKRASEPWGADERRRLAPRVASLLEDCGARLHWCDELDGPALLGFRSPVIALPRLHGARLSDEELQHVLLHEAAHLRRRDDWAALVELAVAGLFWVNPVVHLARRSLGLAREMACDDWVVGRTSAPVAYARCLTAVADLQRTPRRSSLAAAATSTRSILSRRVTRVLDGRQRPGANAAPLLALLTPVAVGIVAIALIQAPPLVIDGRADAGAATAAVTASPLAARAGATLFVDVPGATPDPRGALSVVRAGSVAADQVPAVRPAAPPVESAPVAAPAGGAGSPGDVSPAEPLLRSDPLPGVGVPGVPAADAAAATVPMQLSDNASWWRRAARVGSATGDGAAAAGQKTASFFKKIGSSVAQTLTR